MAYIILYENHLTNFYRKEHFYPNQISEEEIESYLVSQGFHKSIKDSDIWEDNNGWTARYVLEVNWPYLWDE